jgi:hypothetical protein
MRRRARRLFSPHEYAHGFVNIIAAKEKRAEHVARFGDEG